MKYTRLSTGKTRLSSALRRTAFAVMGIALPVAALVTGFSVKPASALSSCPTALYSTGSSPSVSGYNASSSAIDLGVEFGTRGTTSTTGIRFLAGNSEGSSFTVYLSKTDGTVLASTTPSYVANGWWEGTFASPVFTPEGSYVAWRTAPNGQNPYKTNGVASGLGASNDAVYVASGSKSLYELEPQSGNPSNTTPTEYFISPVVSDSDTPDNPTFSTVVNAESNTLSVSYGYDSYMNESEPISASSAQRKIYRNDTLIATLAGATGHGSADTVKFQDFDATKGASTTYKVTSVDPCGNESSGNTTTVTSSSEGTVFGDSGAASSRDTSTNPVELGLKFSSDTSGNVYGVRVYRYVAMTGTPVATLWTSGGTALATSTTSTGGVLPGWQEFRFSSPVAISASTTYVVSYFSPNGNYQYASGALSSAVTNGHLTAPATGTTANGVYKYGSSSAFPNQNGGGTWYGVDVIFQ